jgi:hypothetical protein
MMGVPGAYLMVCILYIAKVIIENILYINCCTGDCTISLNFVEVRLFEFTFCESVYDLEYGRKSQLSVRLLVCCVV